MPGKEKEKTRFQSCKTGAQSNKNANRKTVCCKLTLIAACCQISLSQLAYLLHHFFAVSSFLACVMDS